VVDFHWNGRYPKKKNWGACGTRRSKHDWVLIVDADEWITPELAEEVQAHVIKSGRARRVSTSTVSSFSWVDGSATAGTIRAGISVCSRRGFGEYEQLTGNRRTRAREITRSTKHVIARGPGQLQLQS
jgi:hypothetical protein